MKPATNNAADHGSKEPMRHDLYFRTFCHTWRTPEMAKRTAKTMETPFVGMYVQ